MAEGEVEDRCSVVESLDDADDRTKNEATFIPATTEDSESDISWTGAGRRLSLGLAPEGRIGTRK